MPNKKPVKLTLLTNIDFAEVHSLRLDVHAILLETNVMGLGDVQQKIRGFGTEGAWEVFTKWLPVSPHPYEITPFSNGQYQMLGQDGELKPLFSGSVLRAGGFEIVLQHADQKRPLDIHEDTDHVHVWDVLARKTREHWHWPAMPSLSYAPIGRRA